MKKIIKFLCIYFVFFSILNIFANNSWTVLNNNDQVQIFLESSSWEVSVWESFKLILNITNSWNFLQINNPEILWIENFSIYSTSQSTNMSIINNNVSNKTIFTFSVKPLKSWIFTIWPSQINIWWKVFQSNIVKIKVNNLNLNKQNNIDTEVAIPNLIESNKNSNFFNLEKFIYIFWIILVFGIIVTYFYISYIDNKKNINIPKTTIINNNYISVDNLEENKYLDIIYDYFKKNYNIDSRSLTFKELLLIEKNPVKKDVLKKIFNLLNQKLYSKHDINKEELLNLLKNFINYT